jgi:hypothetical protein
MAIVALTPGIVGSEVGESGCQPTGTTTQHSLQAPGFFARACGNGVTRIDYVGNTNNSSYFYNNAEEMLPAEARLRSLGIRQIVTFLDSDL